jgi:transmembrane 9 superfamily protein 2/4
MMIYAAWYNVTELSLDGFVPMMIYFGYMTVLSMYFFLITGTIGFFSSYYFNVTIYSYLKVD